MAVSAERLGAHEGAARMMHVMIRSLFVVLLLAVGVAAQSSTPSTGTVSLDGQPLQNARATLDPRHGLLVEGERDGVSHGFMVTYPVLQFPRPVKHALRAWSVGGFDYKWRTEKGYRRLTAGTFQVTAFDGARVAAQLEFSLGDGEPEHQLVFDLKPQVATLRPVDLHGVAEVSGFPEPVDRPSLEDLVFCAVGGTGTGLPGAAGIVDSIAKLAPTGPLDFVLLLGDNFYPRGVSSVTDSQWQSKFENLFDTDRFRIPFYPTIGRADARGNREAQLEYGAMSPRWVMPTPTYSFDLQSHGVGLSLISLDTAALTGNIGDSSNRDSLRRAIRGLRQSESQWKIVYGYHSIFSNGKARGSLMSTVLEERLAIVLEETDADVYIGGDGNFLEMLEPRAGVLHMVSGGGGGAEMAESVHSGEGTMFAHTGGGFTWFRFDGKTLEISMRDAQGAVLFVHHLTKTGGPGAQK